MRPALTDPGVSPADWMSAIDGNRLLSALTLPGSHDTCAWTVDDRLVRTQHATLDDQLHHGVRVLDIRCRHERDRSIQDEFRVPVPTSIAFKWRAIDSLLNLTPGLCGERWVINFCSGTGMAAPPVVVASGDTQHRGIHEQLAGRLAARSEPCGTMMLDFCDWKDWRQFMR
ncbi:hypothetical protein R69919_03639 [Paraburkholderia gardini]|nr:hypothetical protein R69919_03639 [Paraburkholderia gardini]